VRVSRGRAQLTIAVLLGIAGLAIACEGRPLGPDIDVAPPAIDMRPPPMPPPRPPGDVGSEAPCPGYEPPTPGTACVEHADPDWDLTCEYGHDLDRQCNEIVECRTGVWREQRQPSCFGRCPASFDEIVPGAPCADSAVGCSYLEGTCACVPDVGGLPDGGDPDAATAPIPGTWRCAPPPGGGCPPQRPPLGSDCVRAMTCDYGACALGRDVVYACDSSARRWVQADYPDCD